MGNDAAPPDSAAIAARLGELIRIPTVSGDEKAAAAFVDALERLYPRLHAALEHDRIPPLGLCFRGRGVGAGGEPLVAMAHYDVVPAPDAAAWTHPPFSGAIADGHVWGRGALDDKGALCVLLEAVEGLLAEGFRPARDAVLAFGGDEEVLGASGRAIAESFKRRGETPWLVVDEGGAVVDTPLPFVDLPAAMIGVGEKGAMTVRLRATSPGGHASAPPQRTAIGRLARALRRLEHRPFPARASETLLAMLAAFAQRAEGRGRALLRALATSGLLTARTFARLGGEPAALVRTTVAPTRLAAGTADNVLAPEASATLNLRLAPGDRVGDALAGLRRRIRDREVAIELVAGEDPTPASPLGTPQWRLLERAVDAVWPGMLVGPYFMMAATDARHWHRFAPAVHRFAPLEMPGELRATIHAVDERVPVAALGRGVAFWRALLMTLPGEEAP